MKQKFIDHRFSKESLEMIETITTILDDYRQQGYRLSLRQLYYQLVAKDLIPNTVQSYNKIGNLVSNARQAGLIDWSMIEDRGRETVSNSHWSSPADILESAAYSFKIDLWEDQPWHVECMVEKDALSGVLEPVCRKADIRITANKGYCSSSTMYEIGKRLSEQHNLFDKDICILYLGDHDPSGIDMSRDITERLALYSDLDDIEVIRLALNMNQVKKWHPPENPAKTTDSRFKTYMDKFGRSSWELDAVSPEQLASLVSEAVNAKIDDEKMIAALHRQKKMKDHLQKLATDYREKHSG